MNQATLNASTIRAAFLWGLMGESHRNMSEQAAFDKKSTKM